MYDEKYQMVVAGRYDFVTGSLQFAGISLAQGRSFSTPISLCC